VPKSYVGAGPVTLQGDTATPSNVLISTTSNAAINLDSVVGKWVVKGLKLQTTTSGVGLLVQNGSHVDFQNMDFGACVGPHMYATGGSAVTCIGPYTISGGSGYHSWCESSSAITIFGKTLTLTGTPAFSGAFAEATRAAVIICTGNTYTGAATGKRYDASVNGVLVIGADVLPGNVAGTTATGGQVA
jgi:hypothetical protein